MGLLVVAFDDYGGVRLRSKTGDWGGAVLGSCKGKPGEEGGG